MLQVFKYLDGEYRNFYTKYCAYRLEIFLALISQGVVFNPSPWMLLQCVCREYCPKFGGKVLSQFHGPKLGYKTIGSEFSADMRQRLVDGRKTIFLRSSKRVSMISIVGVWTRKRGSLSSPFYVPVRSRDLCARSFAKWWVWPMSRLEYRIEN